MPERFDCGAVRHDCPRCDCLTSHDRHTYERVPEKDRPNERATYWRCTGCGVLKCYVELGA